MIRTYSKTTYDRLYQYDSQKRESAPCTGLLRSTAMAKLRIRKEVLWTLLVVVLIAAVIIPVVIVYTTAEEDAGNRIACFPLLERDGTIDPQFCQSKGCVYNDDAGVSVKCYIPLDGSNSYGYQVAQIF